MTLYLLERLRPTREYDASYGFVVRASSPTEARRIAYEATLNPEDLQEFIGRGGEERWLHEEDTSCERIDAEGEPAVVLHDFHSG